MWSEGFRQYKWARLDDLVNRLESERRCMDLKSERERGSGRLWQGRGPAAALAGTVEEGILGKRRTNGKLRLDSSWASEGYPQLVNGGLREGKTWRWGRWTVRGGRGCWRWNWR